ncbi:MAG: hypothetical protein Q4B81_02475 [Moraxella sp.]|nr:hypothetical protein [Moraxella sp.]
MQPKRIKITALFGRNSELTGTLRYEMGNKKGLVLKKRFVIFIIKIKGGIVINHAKKKRTLLYLLFCQKEICLD